MLIKLIIILLYRVIQETKVKSNDLIDQLKHRSIKYTSHSIELVRPRETSTNTSLFKRHVYLKNTSDQFKCLVYPVLCQFMSGREVPLKLPPSTTTTTSSEINYDTSTGTRVRLVVVVSSSSNHYTWNHSDGHVWMEIRRGDEVAIQIEVSQSSASCSDVSDLRVCFFYAESDVAAYAAYNYHQAASSSSSESGAGHSLVDSLARRFVGNNAELVNAGEQLCSSAMNESTVSRLNYRPGSGLSRSSTSLSASSTSINDDSTLAALNMSSLMTRLGSKPRTSRDDYLRLFRQALKCFLVSFTLTTTSSQESSNYINKLWFFECSCINYANYGNNWC